MPVVDDPTHNALRLGGVYNYDST